MSQAAVDESRDPAGAASTTMHAERVQSAETTVADETPSLPRAPWGLRLLWSCLPKTMAGLVAAGTIVAALPLVASLVAMGLALAHLVPLGERMVAEGQRLERLGAELRDRLDDLERVGRQYLVLEEPQLLPLFQRRLLAAEQTASLIVRSPLPDTVEQPARALLEGLTQVDVEWQPGRADEETLRLAVDRVHELGANTEQIVSAGRSAIYGRLQQLQQQSMLAGRVLLGSALALIPLTALLTFGFSKVVAYPLTGLRAAIVGLGRSDYERPIVIHYPREMSRLGEKLDWLRRRLRGLEADKDRFLRHVSHELKTPLASLREGADLLLDRSFGALGPQQSEIVQILAESAQDLDEQISNLLAYAEWRSGQRQLSLDWIDSRALLDEVLSAHRLPMSKRGLIARLEVHHPKLYGQRSHLRVAVSNLLSNAIKHAPSGTMIDISADCREERCQLAVRDRGHGIAPADRARILRPFERGAEPEEARVRGTGIGLSIVTETVRAHGGTLEVQDAAPGARIVLDWPCPDAQAAAA